MQTTLRTLREELREAKIEVAKLGSECAALREARAADHAQALGLPPLSRSVN